MPGLHLSCHPHILPVLQPELQVCRGDNLMITLRSRKSCWMHSSSSPGSPRISLEACNLCWFRLCGQEALLDGSVPSPHPGSQCCLCGQWSKCILCLLRNVGQEVGWSPASVTVEVRQWLSDRWQRPRAWESLTVTEISFPFSLCALMGMKQQAAKPHNGSLKWDDLGNLHKSFLL